MGNTITTDYTKMRAGRVVERWDYVKPDGTRARGEKRVEKCPKCGRNAVRSLFSGRLEYLHVKVYKEGPMFNHVRDKDVCAMPAPDSVKAEFDGHFCVEPGCWREARRHEGKLSALGRCTTHQLGPTDQEVERAIATLRKHQDRVRDRAFGEALDALELREGARRSGS